MCITLCDSTQCAMCNVNGRYLWQYDKNNKGRKSTADINFKRRPLFIWQSHTRKKLISCYIEYNGCLAWCRHININGQCMTMYRMPQYIPIINNNILKPKYEKQCLRNHTCYNICYFPNLTIKLPSTKQYLEKEPTSQRKKNSTATTSKFRTHKLICLVKE